MQVAAYDEQTVQRSEGFDFNTIEFGLASPSLVFDILCNRMYQNPLRTMVQEYMANARDAHREICKEDVPIQVTLPNEIDPHIRIRDFGPGISPDRMEQIFILLGASTKRDSNLQTGGFGIGAKVGWAYTKSFIITSIVDGVQRQYLAFLGDKNIGQLSTLPGSGAPTTEPDGVEICIRIAIEDFRAVEQAAQYVSYFWKTAPTVINNKNEWEHYTGDYDKPRLESVPTISGGTFIAVVDGIPYTIDKGSVPALEDVHSTQNIKASVCLFFGVGGVDVGVNREGLRYSDKTLAAVDVFIADIDRQVAESKKKVLMGTTFADKMQNMSAVFTGLLKENEILVPLADNCHRVFIRGYLSHSGVKKSVRFTSDAAAQQKGAAADIKPVVNYQCEKASELVSKMRYKIHAVTEKTSFTIDEKDFIDNTYIWHNKSKNHMTQPPKPKAYTALLEVKLRDHWARMRVLSVPDKDLYDLLASMGAKKLEDVSDSTRVPTYNNYVSDDVKDINNRRRTIKMHEMDPTRHVWCQWAERADAEEKINRFIKGNTSYKTCYYVTTEQLKAVKATDIKHYKDVIIEAERSIATMLTAHTVKFLNPIVKETKLINSSKIHSLFYSIDTELDYKIENNFVRVLTPHAKELGDERFIALANDVFILGRYYKYMAQRVGKLRMHNASSPAGRKSSKRLIKCIYRRLNEVQARYVKLAEELYKEYPLVTALSSYSISSSMLKEVKIYIQAKNGLC